MGVQWQQLDQPWWMAVPTSRPMKSLSATMLTPFLAPLCRPGDGERGRLADIHRMSHLLCWVSLLTSLVGSSMRSVPTLYPLQWVHYILFPRHFFFSLIFQNYSFQVLSNQPNHLPTLRSLCISFSSYLFLHNKWSIKCTALSIRRIIPHNTFRDISKWTITAVHLQSVPTSMLVQLWTRPKICLPPWAGFRNTSHPFNEILGVNWELGISAAEISDVDVKSPVHTAFLYLLPLLGPDFVWFLQNDELLLLLSDLITW